MADSLIGLLTDSRRPRILVVGDVMLDRYQWGEVARISPEAPVPVLQVGQCDDRLGGAGNVAAMAAALEADVVLAAVTGDDPEGRILRQLLDDIHVDTQFIVTDPGRPTTVKHRLLGEIKGREPQQVLRLDRERCQPLSPSLAGALLQTVWDRLDQTDLILVSDYDKGVCAGDFVPQLVAIARAADVPVVADPARGVDYHRYTGCTALTPNRIEAGSASRISIRSPDDGLVAARLLLRLGIRSAVVTLDRDGIAWADSRNRHRVFPVQPRQVRDVTGAGDAVLSTLGFCMALGADDPEAVELANLAGGLEVERLGVVPIRRCELLAELDRAFPCARRKIVSRERLLEELRVCRRSGRRIVMTNGCFDLLHPGHVACLEEARRLGDVLVVGLNSDRSVAALKGRNRPIIDQEGRATMVAALACVDYVVIFDETSVEGLVRQVQPDVLVKSAQYRLDQVVGREVVESYGGRVVLAPMQKGYSTTRLVERIAGGLQCAANGQ